MDILTNVGFILIGFILLVLGGNWLLKSAIGISLKLNISKAIIGMTVVSLATSMPELIVSLTAALNGSSAIALGNVIGSNISNIGFILSVTAIILPIVFKSDFYKFEFLVMILASFLLLITLLDMQISRLEGMAMVAFLILFLVLLIKKNKKNKLEEEDPDMIILPNWKILIFLILGSVGLWQGSELLVSGAKNIATTFGVSERIIGITIVAIGTSVPELAASVIAAVKKETDISLGNIVGSNIFNILCVMGLVSTISPISFTDVNVINNDMVWMLVFSLLLLPLGFITPKNNINRIKGVLLLFLFVSFIIITLL